MPAELQESFRLIRQHTSTPIAVGEVFNTIHDCQQLMQEQLIDFIRTTVVHAGGISHLRKIAALAELYHVRTGSHGATDLSPVCMAAALHFDLSVHNFGIQEYMPHTRRDRPRLPAPLRFRRRLHASRARRRASASRSTRRWPRSILTNRRICPSTASRTARFTVGNTASLEHERAPATLPLRRSDVDMTRRDALKTAGLTAVAAGLPETGLAQMSQAPIAKPTKLRITQSVCQWCYRTLDIKDFFKGVADSGLTVVDLLNEEQWTLAKDFGLKCSMGYAGAGSIPDGLNDPKFHDVIVEGMTKTDSQSQARRRAEPDLLLRQPARDERRGRDQELDRLPESGQGLAEDNGITVSVELLNSKVDHKDYMGDRTPYGAEIIRAVNSPHVKLLYDIYHMQIMEGDVIRTLRTYKDAIGHYHTGGVPGRHELDATQELNWPAITQAIIETGFKGFMAHEFIPVRDPLTSLREAISLCDV